MQGLNPNSRIWQVPEGHDPHEHALGPAPDDEEHHAAFPMPSIQFMPGLMGAGGGQVLLSEWQLAGKLAEAGLGRPGVQNCLVQWCGTAVDVYCSVNQAGACLCAWPAGTTVCHGATLLMLAYLLRRTCCKLWWCS
jgi:hypothetical protein